MNLISNLRLEILWYNMILINEIKRRGSEEMPKPIELPEILQREDFDELYRREKHPRVNLNSTPLNKFGNS